MNLNDIAEHIHAETGISINARDVERILSALLVSGNFWEIVYLSKEPLRIVVDTIEILSRRGFLQIDGKEITFSDEGRKNCLMEGISPIPDNRCIHCSGRSVSTADYSPAMKKFLEIQEQRPEAIRNFDQAYVTASTVFSRLAIADSRGDIRNRDILILGDDDLMTLALALSGLPERIVTFEIDSRIVDFLEYYCKDMNVDVQVEKRDLRQALSVDMVGRFQTFFCDPPESISGMKLFLQRGLAGIKGPGCCGYFGLTHVESSYSKWGALQKLLLDSGLVITDLISDFNEYVNWGYHQDMLAWEIAPCKIEPDFNWYRSSLVRVEVLKAGTVVNEDVYDMSIFSDGESSTT